MLGQGIEPQSYHPIVDMMDEQELRQFMQIQRQKVDNVLKPAADAPGIHRPLLPGLALQPFRYESYDLIPVCRRKLAHHVSQVGRQMGSGIAICLECEMIEERAPHFALVGGHPGHERHAVNQARIGL